MTGDRGCGPAESEALVDRGVGEADHLQRFARLSRQIHVSRLRIPADLSRLDETVRLIETMVGKR